MTAMTGDKGAICNDPTPCINKEAEYFGTIRVKVYTFMYMYDFKTPPGSWLVN